ncbi:MAG: D-alanine-D-alanine ligase, partial [Pseudomonadota bacterium]
MKKINVALLFGGRSAEHEVSLNSARNIAAAIDKNKFNLVLMGLSKSGSWYLLNEVGSYKSLIDAELSQKFPSIGFTFKNGKARLFNTSTNDDILVDIAFPILHGTFGEDGCVQGFFKMLNIPCVGCGVLSSAAGMDKDVMKKIFTHAGIPNSPYVLVRPWQPHSYKELCEKLGSPFFIKPANAGSSVGVHKIKSEQDYETKLKDAFLYDSKVIAEKFIPGREIEISVLGLSHSPKVSEPGEIRVLHEFYSYEAKYLDEQGAEIIIPAILSEATKNQVKALAAKAYTAINASGFARIDFFVQESGEIYLNEINTLPGFTNVSMFPKMWEATGLKYSDLITKIVD